MIKGLLFDKDGTLFDFDATWGAWAKQFISELSLGDDGVQGQLSEAFKLDWTAGKFLPNSPIIAGTFEEIIKAVLNVRPDIDRHQLVEMASQGGQDAELVAVCDLASLFEDLSINYKLGIATNDTEKSARGHIERAGVARFFDFVVGWDSGYGAKPHKGMCTAFAIHAKLDPTEIVMIGDSEFDILAGKAAGMTTLGVLTGPAAREELSLIADDVINSIENLPRWLSNWNMQS